MKICKCGFENSSKIYLKYLTVKGGRKIDCKIVLTINNQQLNF